MKTNTHTIWTATQELDIDNLAGGCSVLNILDLISDGDEFLEIPCTIQDGDIYIGSIRYYDAD